MNIWDPYNPVVYFLHTLLGTIGVLAAVTAFYSRKGSTWHIRAGLTFTAFAVVASVTAIIFSVTRFSPFAVVSAFIVVSLVGGAILAVRPRTSFVQMGEGATTVLMALALAALLVMIALPLLDGAPLFAVAWPAAYAVFPAWVLWDDAGFLRADADGRRARRFPRHLSRMAFAFAIAVHAPVVSFGDRWGIDPVLAFFGPFVLWPVLVFAFRAHPLLRVQKSTGTA